MLSSPAIKGLFITVGAWSAGLHYSETMGRLSLACALAAGALVVAYRYWRPDRLTSPQSPA
jgi:hypothetical protein